MRILAFHGHPDDCEIVAGGTLVLLACQGHSITIATMTPGDCGSVELGPEAIGAVRRREAVISAHLIGARYVCAEFRDFRVFNDEASRVRVTEILRRARPELVLTASPEDSDCDHWAASGLVRDCSVAAAVPNYRTGAPNAAPPLAQVPHVYFTDPLAAPEFVVDVESSFLRKQRMVAQHRSQREGAEDYLERMERWTRLRGALAGVEFGEGFRGYKGQGHPGTPLLEELLGEFVRRVAG
jgi:LmbE family N-acetylglucosaminyl deacetylase